MEIWKWLIFKEKGKLYNYYGHYMISDTGKIKSFNNNKILKTRKNNKGYERINLCKNNKQKTFLIHRLVAYMFIPNPQNKPYIDHIDTNPLNNHVSNLRWCTQKENMNNIKTKTENYHNQGGKGKQKNEEHKKKLSEANKKWWKNKKELS